MANGRKEPTVRMKILMVTLESKELDSDITYLSRGVLFFVNDAYHHAPPRAFPHFFSLPTHSYVPYVASFQQQYAVNQPTPTACSRLFSPMMSESLAS
jgi:hypothetical protein